mgnify:CR=1 FL=1
MAALPKITFDKIFDMVGGSRVYLIRAGPGNRSVKERTEGKCDLSFSNDHGQTNITDYVQSTVARALEEITTRNNKFTGPSKTRVVTRPLIFHDGQPKSIDAYNIYKSSVHGPFDDGMKLAPESMTIADVTADFFWSHLNRTDASVLNTIFVFSGTETIYRVLAAANCHARLLAGSGTVIPVVFPVVGKPSMGIGMGPFAPNFLRWGNITEEEAAAVSKTPPTKKTSI